MSLSSLLLSRIFPVLVVVVKALCLAPVAVLVVVVVVVVLVVVVIAVVLVVVEAAVLPLLKGEDTAAGGVWQGLTVAPELSRLSRCCLPECCDFIGVLGACLVPLCTAWHCDFIGVPEACLVPLCITWHSDSSGFSCDRMMRSSPSSFPWLCVLGMQPFTLGLPPPSLLLLVSSGPSC